MKKKHCLMLCILLNNATSALSDQASRSLFQAAREGKREVIKEHLENNENCAIKDENGNNLLHIAAEHDHPEVIEALTKYRGWWQYYIWGPTLPNIDEKNNDDCTPLETSIDKKQYRTIIALLEAKKLQQKTESEQIKTLLIATHKDDPSSIYLLEQYGYNPHLQNQDGNTLHYALRHNKKKAIGYLARKTTLINAKNNNHEAPIMIAVENEDEDEIDFLAHVGADINIAGKNGMRPLHTAKSPHIVDCLLRNKAAIDVQDDGGHTPLHYHTSQGNQEMVIHLIKSNADIKKRNNKGEAPFAIATNYGQSNVAKTLAEHPDSDVNERDNSGQTSFIRAAAKKDFAKMKELTTNYNVDISLCDNKQENALHKLAHNGYIDGAQLVLGINSSLLTGVNENGDLPIMIAAQHNQHNFLRFLIGFGSPLNTKNNKGETIIHEAGKKKSSDLLIEVLKKFPLQDIQAQDNNGFTFMHHASAHDSIENIKIAKKYGLLFSHKTKSGDTCAHIAAKNNSVHTLRYFRENGERFDVRNNNNETPFIAGVLDGQLQATQYLLSEEHFINKEIAFLLNKLQYVHTYEQQKVYSFIKQKHEDRLSECKKIFNEYTETTNIINANKHSITLLTEKNPGYFFTYQAYIPTSPRYESVDHIYAKTKEERTALLNHYLQCKNKELKRKITFERHINEIRIEEERMRAARLAELEAQRKQEAERVAIEQQRIRVAQHKGEQRKHTEQRARAQAQIANNNVQIVAQQNQAANEVVEENSENKEDAAAQSETCCICYEKKPVILIPCKKAHTDLICAECLEGIKKTTKICPMCRGSLA